MHPTYVSTTMSFQFEQPTPAFEAQIDELHSLGLAVIGGIGELAAFGAYTDETLSLPLMKYDEEEEAIVPRDIDVLALKEPMRAGWYKANPAATDPNPLDLSIHALLYGGVKADLQLQFFGKDPMVHAIPGLPEEAYQLHERVTANGLRLWTPKLGVMYAIREGFVLTRDYEGSSQNPKTADFRRRFLSDAIPDYERLDDTATDAIIQRIANPT